MIQSVYFLIYLERDPSYYTTDRKLSSSDRVTYYGVGIWKFEIDASASKGLYCPFSQTTPFPVFYLTQARQVPLLHYPFPAPHSALALLRWLYISNIYSSNRSTLIRAILMLTDAFYKREKVCSSTHMVVFTTISIIMIHDDKLGDDASTTRPHLRNRKN